MDVAGLGGQSNGHVRPGQIKSHEEAERRIQPEIVGRCGGLFKLPAAIIYCLQTYR